MPTIFLIRHAMPVATRDAPAADWPLSNAGIAAARALEVPQEARMLASNERKAIETVTQASRGAQVTTDAGFGEVRRVEPFGGDFRERRHAWVSGRCDERHRLWETQADVGRRFTEALRVHRAEQMVVGTHGMALTAWLVHVGALAAGDPAADFWARLAFPDMVVAAADDGLLRASIIRGAAVGRAKSPDRGTS